MRITKSRFVIGPLMLVVSLPGYVIGCINCVSATVKPVILTFSTLDHVDFDRLDFDSVTFQPLDGGFDLAARTFEFEADDADFIGHTGLPNVGDDFELAAQFPDHGTGDQLG